MIIDTKTYQVVKSQQFKFEVRPSLRAPGLVPDARRSGRPALRRAVRARR